jgi:hypothetical protein
MTRGDFATKVLKGLGAPVTIHTRRALQAEMQAEGGEAKFNPFNTTLRRQGSTNYNTARVQNYVTAAQGVAATVRTLKEDQPGYARIRRRLRENAPASKILAAIGESSWGTSGTVALEVLDDIKHDRKPNTLAILEAKEIAH